MVFIVTRCGDIYPALIAIKYLSKRFFYYIVWYDITMGYGAKMSLNKIMKFIKKYEIVTDFDGKPIQEKTSRFRRIEKLVDFRSNGDTYTRYFDKNGQVYRTELVSSDCKSITAIRPKDNDPLLKTANQFISYSDGTQKVVHHKDVLLINNFPFSVSCCSENKSTIKAATMQLI